MATLVAEELDADWAQVRVVAAPVDTNIYKNLTFGFRGTGGSSSVANAYEQMRRMGAMARAAGAGRRTELENLGAGNYRAGGQDPPCRQRARGGLRRIRRAGRHAAAARSCQPDVEGSGQFHPDRQNARPAPRRFAGENQRQRAVLAGYP